MDAYPKHDAQTHQLLKSAKCVMNTTTDFWDFAWNRDTETRVMVGIDYRGYLLSLQHDGTAQSSRIGRVNPISRTHQKRCDVDSLASGCL